MGNNGLGADILASYLESESEGSNPGEFGIDTFSNAFEDEFPGDNEDPGGGTYAGYSPEGNRAAENRPWGGTFGDRPKIHELNQPDAAQFLGWRAIDLIPRRNVKEVFHRLAGTPAELRQIIQIVQATRRLTGANIDFDQWFELWRNGFLDFTENRTFGNFQIVGEAQWARFKDPETRPRWREWSNSIQRADYGFRVGEYWPNASETNSILLSGTDLQLINHVIQIEYEGGGTKIAEKSNSKHLPSFKGQPLIKLYFLGIDGGEAETSFRIMDKSDDPKSPLTKIDKPDLRVYAARIKEHFATPIFVWEKGKEVISYKNRWQGFDGQWWLCRNQVVGQALLAKLLAVAALPLDSSKVRISKATDELAAFPANPADVVVLGETVKQDAERPLVDVSFYRAEIKLSKLRHPIALVERGRIVYE